jgi:hypothetical protein
VTEDEAESRIADLEDALSRIRQWCDAYPVNVFIPPTAAQIKASVDAMKAPGCASSDAMHASWARHILDGVRNYTDIVDEKP